MNQITLAFNSRLKQTNIYTREGKTFFGIWKPPQIQLDGDEKIVRIGAHDAGGLEFIAFREYGDNSLWWAIALVNNIANVVEETIQGKEITIPKLDNINAALLDNR